MPQSCSLELQGHQIKNKDLMVASGAITLKGTEVLDELQEDEEAVSTFPFSFQGLHPHCYCSLKTNSLKRTKDSPQ